MSDYGPQVTAARLYRRKSASGNDYFAGRWGGCKVALLKSRETADDGAEIWNLVISEAPQRQADKPETRQAAAPSESKRDWQRPIGADGQTLDVIPF